MESVPFQTPTPAGHRAGLVICSPVLKLAEKPPDERAKLAEVRIDSEPVDGGALRMSFFVPNISLVRAS